MSFLLGLTGSIGMGKSTTARLFAERGCAVWDADAAVHRLYAPGGAAVVPMGAAFPDAIVDGGVSREALKRIIATDPTALKRIETIVHPLVGEDRAAFVAQARADIIVLDIPLLFEGGSADRFDATVTVSAPAEVQRQRVLDRGAMTAPQFEMILAKQMPDARKRALADHVVITDTMEHAAQQVAAIVDAIRKRLQHA
ncbi:dephospho-CoA kinase [Pseudooceanicola aestuarii]|uniref:dephospho-CoA kinase n=1 Tax=Pseudooceanicola aestuarii TaxID=2697319 RepID=UPI0013D605DF|nr:dephospho-CoA kinase [Pseudooceanicola aestuarii]